MVSSDYHTDECRLRSRADCVGAVTSLADSVPGGLKVTHQCNDGWQCEKHTDQPMSHDDCGGAGILCGPYMLYLTDIRIELPDCVSPPSKRHPWSTHGRMTAITAPGRGTL